MLKDINIELLDAAKAFQELCVCYRIGKKPSEKLFDRLQKARELLEDIKNGKK